jgi:alpha-tubulin suppressor-like RCC1 family protein
VGAGVVVTAAISEGGGTVGGTTTATTANDGVATFANLSIGGLIGPRMLAFSAPGVTGVSTFVQLVAGLPAILTLHEGNNQSAVIGSPVRDAVSVKVTDLDGNAVGAGVTVTFAVGTGGGSVSGATQTTNSEGIARVGGWRLGENPGGNTLTASSPAPVDPDITFSASALAAFKAQSISVGDVHACARSLEGVSYCWGSNVLPGNSTGGSLGIGESGGFRVVPTEVIGGQTFQSLLAGAGHTCGLTSGGAAYCWGWNLHYGQVGDGSSENRYAPVAVAGGLTFENLAPGGIHTCGVNTNGAAYCWGGNLWGQLGDGSKVDRRAPVPVLGGLEFQSLAAGGQHTCGLVDGGTAYCWGRNNVGQIGNERLEDRSDPDAIAGGLAFERLTAGDQHTCGLTSLGAAYCWGYAYFGQLGDGTSGSTPEGYGTLRRSPVSVAGNLRFSDLSAGRWHTCGVAVSGSLYCWGRIANHEFGAVPAPIAPGITFKKIATGGNLTCGIATDDTVYCLDGTNSPPRRVQAP